jgi:hypothetical protein
MRHYMRIMPWIALPCFLWAEPPLTLDEVLAKSKAPIAKLNVDAILAEGRLQVKGASGFMRESPSVSVSAGPRAGAGAPSSSDQTIELEAPLMLNRGPARQLASRLDSSAPLLYSAADLDNRLSIHQAFLGAWLAQHIEAVRADDYIQVKGWLEIAKARSESGADPAFQLEMVKGELIKSRLDWEEAKRARIQAWNVLRSLSDLPEAPQGLEHHHQEGALGKGGINAKELEARYQNGAMRRASAARQGIEQGQINLQTALSDSRWNLSGSYAKESDERITKIGIAYRFRRSGEASAIRAEQRARLETSKRNTELELAALDLRFASAMQTLASSEGYPDAPDIAASLEALTLRLQEGKDRPSEAIPMRRQFLEIRIAELQRSHSLNLARAELLTLTAGN